MIQRLNQLLDSPGAMCIQCDAHKLFILCGFLQHLYSM